MKLYSPLLMVLVLVFTSFVGNSNEVEENVVDKEDSVEEPLSGPPMDLPWSMVHKNR